MNTSITTNTIQSTDTQSVTIYNPYYELNDTLINNWYSRNNITQYSTKDKQGHRYNQLSINKINIARAYNRPNNIGMNQYQDKANYIQGTLTINFAGIKSYNQKHDTIKDKVINNLLTMLQKNNIAFQTKRVDIANDKHNSNFNSMFAMRTNKQGYKHQFNSPFNQPYQTTFYLEQYTNQPSLKALIYDKSIKEKDKHNNIIDNGIVRPEISIRTTNQQHKVISTKEQYINHIQKQLNKYMFVEFPNQSAANELKKEYELMINNGITKPSTEFINKIKELKGKYISTQLTEQTKEFLSLCYCEQFNDKLKATYTEPEINLNKAVKERTKRTATLKGLFKSQSKQQKLFKAALKKRWNISAPTVQPTEQRTPKITPTLSLLKSFTNGSIFQVF